MKKWYAVRRGLFLGVFSDWNEVKDSIGQIESPEFKSFPTKKLAESWLKNESVDCDFTIKRIKSEKGTQEFSLSWVCLDYKSKMNFADELKMIDKIYQVLTKLTSASTFSINDIHTFTKLKNNQQFVTFFQNHKVRYTGRVFNNPNNLNKPTKVSIPIMRPVVIDESL